MSRSLDDLRPEFRTKAEFLLEQCMASGYVMRPFFTLRSPWEQARLYRQSRNTATVNRKYSELIAAGAEFLAKVLRDVGPQKTGPWRTNALPGESWHQWGLAMDCFLLRNGTAIWDMKDAGYEAYVRHARGLGLTSGAGFNDPVHVQFPMASGPRDDGKSWADIDAAMRALWEGKEEA